MWIGCVVRLWIAKIWICTSTPYIVGILQERSFIYYCLTSWEREIPLLTPTLHVEVHINIHNKLEQIMKIYQLHKSEFEGWKDVPHSVRYVTICPTRLTTSSNDLERWIIFFCIQSLGDSATIGVMVWRPSILVCSVVHREWLVVGGVCRNLSMQKQCKAIWVEVGLEWTDSNR